MCVCGADVTTCVCVCVCVVTYVAYVTSVEFLRVLTVKWH